MAREGIVGGTKTTDVEHIVPVDEFTLRLLRDHLDTFGPGADGFVFSNTAGSPVNQGDWSSTVTPLIREVAGPRFVPHNLRAAFTKDVRKIAGHAVAAALTNHVLRDDIVSGHYDSVDLDEMAEGVATRGRQVAPDLFAELAEFADVEANVAAA